MENAITEVLKFCGDHWLLYAAAVVFIALMKKPKSLKRATEAFDPRNKNVDGAFAHNTALQKSDSSKRSGSPLSERRQVSPVARQGLISWPPRVVTQICVCAVFDRPFIDRYERQASGLYCQVEGQRILEGGRPCSGAETGQILSVDEIDGPNMPCPWCAEIGAIRYHCGGCCAVVCGGKVRGRVFHCRPSCGQSWVGRPLHEIEVTEERERLNLRAPPHRGSVLRSPARRSDFSRMLPPRKKG